MDADIPLCPNLLSCALFLSTPPALIFLLPHASPVTSPLLKHCTGPTFNFVPKTAEGQKRQEGDSTLKKRWFAKKKSTRGPTYLRLPLSTAYHCLPHQIRILGCHGDGFVFTMLLYLFPPQFNVLPLLPMNMRDTILCYKIGPCSSC